MTFIKVKTCANRTEAENAKSYLALIGIQAQIQAHDMVGMRPALALSNGVDLMVLDKDANSAIKLFAKMEEAKR